MTALGRIARGLAALAALGALLIGVPWGLWHFIGWPLPHSLPTWEQVSQALNSNGIPDELLFNSLAVVCWAAWAALAVSVAVEVPAAVAGVAARRVPLTGPMQFLARQLVAAVLLLLPPISSRPALAAPSSSVAWAAPATPVTALVSPVRDLGTSTHHPIGTTIRSALRSTATTAPAGPQELPSHRVAPKDTLWGLAERYLGDPLRWREIFDLNLGRPQPDGDQLVNEDLIRPGWILLLPTDAHVPAPPPPARGNGAGPDSGARPGTTTPAQPEPAAPEPSTSPPIRHEPDGEAPATTTSQRHEGGRSPSPIVQLPLGGVVGLSLALAISAALAAARLHRRRRWRPADPAPGLAHHDPLVTDTVDRLVRAARAATEPDDDAADDANGLQPDIAKERPAPPSTPAAFGVITVGHRDGEELALNIPATGGLALNGPGAVAAARAIIVTAIARNPEAEVEVVVAGTDLVQKLLPGVGAIAGLEVVADLDAALRRVEVEALYRARLLDDADTSTIDQFRKNHPSEPLPLLLLIASTPPAVLGGRLAALLDSSPRFGIGAMIIGDVTGMGALEVDMDGAVTAAPDEPGPLHELRDAHMMMLHPDQGREALVMVAASHGEPPVPITDDSGEPEAPAPSAFDRSATLKLVSDAPRPVRVRLLGPIRIEANEVEVRKGLRGAAREFLALLLIHPEGVDVEVAAETLWPDAPPPRGVERLRTALGNLRTTLRNATGIEKAVVSYAAGRYQIQLDLIDADLWRFQTALAEVADASEPAARTAALQQVVEAYGGDLAEGERYGWVEPLREDLRRRALDAAANLADLHERDGNTHAALAVVEQAVAWDPYAEELYRRLMRLNAAIGRTDELRRVFQRLTTRLDELDADPDDTTRRLFDELTGSTKRRRH